MFKNRNIFGHRLAVRRGFPKGAHFRSAPLADFFGYFLVRDKKVTLRLFLFAKKVYVFEFFFYLSAQVSQPQTAAGDTLLWV